MKTNNDKDASSIKDKICNFLLTLKNNIVESYKEIMKDYDKGFLLTIFIGIIIVGFQFLDLLYSADIETVEPSAYSAKCLTTLIFLVAYLILYIVHYHTHRAKVNAYKRLARQIKLSKQMLDYHDQLVTEVGQFLVTVVEYENVNGVRIIPKDVHDSIVEVMEEHKESVKWIGEMEENLNKMGCAK